LTVFSRIRSLLSRLHRFILNALSLAHRHQATRGRILMSTALENDLDLDKLFLPAWAQESAAKNQFAKYEGRDTEPRDDSRARGPRRRPDGSGAAPRGERPGGFRRDDRGPRRDGAGRGSFGDQRGPRRDPPREQRAPAAPAPLPELNVIFSPDEKGVESLARQIRMNGRAYPLFQIARMILQKPERHMVSFSVKKNAEGGAIQPLFVCALDDSPWLSEEEAVAHVLRRHFATFYQVDRTPTEPPKGVYTFVAQCGMSGTVLGPPNYHDYQNKLRKLHTERFARMPFDVFKARVKIVKDEVVVKKWIEEQSFKTEYTCLNVPEPLKLANRTEVEKHFRETHKADIIKPAETHKLTGVAARSLRSPELARLLREQWEYQFGFPLQISTDLSRRFAEYGLQFFKVNKTVTHVSVARPQFLDLETTPVSDGVRHIVEFINVHPKCARRKLIETLAPSPKPAPIPVAPAAGAAPVEGAAPAPAPAPQPAVVNEPTVEQNAVIGDLHWLIHQGHVLEFADGRLETAKKPAPKPPKAGPKPAGTAQPAEAAAPGVVETTPAGEAPSATDLAAEAAAQPPAEIPVAENPPPAEAPAETALAAEADPTAPPAPVVEAASENKSPAS
jgi:hypothetical protein